MSPVPSARVAGARRRRAGRCENDIHQRFDFFTLDLGGPWHRLSQAEGELAELTRIGVNMQLAVAARGTRNEDRLPLLSELFHEPPGIDLGSEGQAGEHAFGAGDFGQTDDLLSKLGRASALTRSVNCIEPPDQLAPKIGFSSGDRHVSGDIHGLLSRANRIQLGIIV